MADHKHNFFGLNWPIEAIKEMQIFNSLSVYNLWGRVKVQTFALHVLTNIASFPTEQSCLCNNFLISRQYQFSLSESSPCQHLVTKVTDDSLQLCSMGCTRIPKVKDQSQCLFLSIYFDILQHPLSSIMCSVRVSVVLKGWENRTCAVKRNCKLKEEYIHLKTWCGA